jgi:2-polyprenyl-3-methyl-5-hydroxy-6-metoxy-1,4-benzoquinol methylase
LDKRIQSFLAVADADLMLCEGQGVAYQRDMRAGRVPYDDAYLAKCQAYEGNSVANAVNAGRCALLMRHLADGASVLDVGAGSGAFVRAAASWGFDACGFDVIQAAADRLRAAGEYAEDLSVFDAVALWDSIEHMEDPATCLESVRAGALLFVSVPVFHDLRAIRASKHYRPGEHLYYWTALGFIDWIAHYGFRLLEQSNHEVAAGRDSIAAFAFCRGVAIGPTA